MKKVFSDSEVPTYLDKIAKTRLLEARKAFVEVGLGDRSVVIKQESIFLFPWRGTTTLDALRLALRRSGLAVDQSSIALRVSAQNRSELSDALDSIAKTEKIDGAELADLDENLQRAKYDHLIPRELLRAAAAIDRLNTSALREISQELGADLLKHKT